jgi:hypothetical protein
LVIADRCANDILIFFFQCFTSLPVPNCANLSKNVPRCQHPFSTKLACPGTAPCPHHHAARLRHHGGGLSRTGLAAESPPGGGDPGK